MDYASLDAIFASEGITQYAAIPFSACRVTLQRLLDREPGFVPRTVLLYLVPYYAGPAENLSLYAAARDYHLFFRAFGEKLIGYLQTVFPTGGFRSYGDHSPIAECDAAAKAGLGVIGRNGLLINRKYASLVFIGDVVTDVPPDAFPACRDPSEISFCENCGCCAAACPTGILSGKGELCLSAVTQKKGELSPEEKDLILSHGSAWGCDLCQLACPHVKRAIGSGDALTPIPFFRENRTPRLTYDLVANMPEDEFKSRAYAWRSRKTLLRNLALLEGREEENHPLS